MKTSRRRLWLHWAAFLGFSVVLTVAVHPNRTFAATTIVQMINYTFDPAQSTVSAGDTIIWTNLDLDVHTTSSGSNTDPTGLWDSPLLVPSDSFTFTFNLAPGSYPYFCRIHYNIGMLGAVTVLAGNVPPSVSISSPGDGSHFFAGTPILVQASASDSDGSVARVDFFANGQPIGSAVNAPYTATFQNTAPGSYSLSAVAVDNQGASSSPAAVMILVQNPGSGPSVIITNPVSGQKFFSGTNILVQAVASDSNAAVTQVTFLLNSNLASTVSSPPYEFILTNIALGSYSLIAMAADSLGLNATSPPVNISVVLPPAPVPPTVTVLTPASGSRFPLGSTVSLAAAASVSNAAITKVQFFANADLVAEITSPPFAFDWIPAQSGLFSITAVALSSQGLTATSSSVNIRVFIPESVRPNVRILRAPSNFTSVTAPEITMSGTAADNTEIDRVEYQINGGPFQPAEGTVTWTVQVTLAPGPNAVGVRSVDAAGNTSLETTRYYTYVVRAPLAVALAGDGMVAPNLDGQMLELGKVYQMTAHPGSGQVFNGWTGVPHGTNRRLNFLMQSNLLLVANFAPNPFTRARNFAGLMLDTNSPQPADSAVIRLRTGTSGFFSGNLGMNGAAYPFHGQFTVFGTAITPVLRQNLAPIALTLQLDLTNNPDTILGTATDGTWTSPVFIKSNGFDFSAHPAPQAGRHPFVFQRAADDGGQTVATGVAAIGKSGLVNLTGQLSDGRGFVFTTAMDQNGDAPFYISSSPAGEIMVGWLNFGSPAGPAVSGSVTWSKPSSGLSAILLAAPAD